MIFQNEGQFIKEWIEYHLLIGVEHFYLYNNNSTDNYKEILQPYVDKGIVTLTEWPEPHGQLSAYADCYQRRKDEVHWLGYIDADEFVNLQRDNSLQSMLRRYRNYSALQLQWRHFGTSGLIEDSGLVIEDFTAAWPWLCNVGKTFINNNYKFSLISCHFHVARFLGIPLYPVNDRKFPSPYLTWLWRRGLGKTAYLNHYFSKSYSWYDYKDRKRTSALSAKNAKVKRSEGRFELHELNNFTRDFSIQRWLVFLKLRMNDKK
ncbi:MAG: glycosyltransferase family 92 protein [Muribaculum sp.]|nr:glycosyltransferase family 92 protein [Muribaculum sp.]